MEKEFEEFLHKEIDPLAEENIPEWKLSRRFREGEFDEYPHFGQLLFAVKGQKEKHEIMDELHEKFRAIDAGEAVTGFTEGHTRTVHWDAESGVGYLTAKDGTLFPVTAGELITDGAWGVSYKLSADVPRDIKRDFVLAEAKRRISEILDDEIGKRKKDSIRNEEFDNLNTKNDDGSFRPGVSGFVAEKLAETFLEKNITDSRLPFRIEKADYYEDTKRKIDLVLHVLEHFRGVNIEGVEQKDIGIQLTVGHHPAYKKRQITNIKRHIEDSTVHIDDIVLVKLPLKNCLDLYEKWKAAGMLPGGPTKLWNTEQKEIVFRGVLKGMVPENKINEMWEAISAQKSYVENFDEEDVDEVETKDRIERLVQKPQLKKPESEAKNDTETDGKKIKTTSQEAYDKMSPRVKSLLSVLNPSEKTKRKIEVEKQHLEQGLKDLLKLPNPSEKTKRKIEEKKQQLDLVMRRPLLGNPVSETENDEKSEEERINTLKQKIEEKSEIVTEPKQKVAPMEEEGRSEEYFRELLRHPQKPDDGAQQQKKQPMYDKNGLRILGE